MSLYNKYLKYKTKYLQLSLKLKQIGGDKPVIKDINLINLFTDLKMEEYLNPIYGMVMCFYGYIPNNFYLSINNLIKTTDINYNDSLLITAISNDTITVRPTTEIIADFKPIDFGRYLALFYFSLENHLYTIIYSNINDESKEIVKDDINKIDKYLSKFRIFKNNEKKIITIEIPKKKNNTTINRTISAFQFKNNEMNTFHIILYCLWWVANNDEGIVQYYIGINEVFSLINKYLINKIELINFNKEHKTDSYEHLLFDICNSPFKIFNQQWAKNFCKDSKPTYPDCGEVTARNLINLLCFSNGSFNIEILNNLEAIEEVKEYYKIFNDFKKQSDNENLNMIYKQNLNARDAWSYLIINIVNKNVNFVKNCISNNTQYEINAGMNLDNTFTNFFQLIKNIFPNITEWENLVKNDITSINDETINGIGNIIIMHKVYGKITIYCYSQHYDMAIDINNKSINYNLLNEKQKNLLDILENKNININNYIYNNIDSNLLEKLLNESSTDINLKYKLFELSITNQFDSDARRRIIINVNKRDYFNFILNFENKKNINDYTYICKNFNFLKKMPNLINLNSLIFSNNYENIDLSPLDKIESIGDNFLKECFTLKSIDCSKLKILKSIGDIFLAYCTSLQTIDLSPLINLESIGNSFMVNCRGLKLIDLSPLINLQSIGNNFCYESYNIKSINLSGLTKLKSIGDCFMNKCSGLISINLSGLTNIKILRDDFLTQCSGLTRINLSELKSLEIIGNKFMDNCGMLFHIDLSNLIYLKSIGDYFIHGGNFGISEIDLSGLISLETIGDNFMDNCFSLTSIDLTPLINLKSIGNNFLYCENKKLIIYCTSDQKKILEKIKYDKPISYQIIIK